MLPRSLIFPFMNACCGFCFPFAKVSRVAPDISTVRSVLPDGDPNPVAGVCFVEKNHFFPSTTYYMVALIFFLMEGSAASPAVIASNTASADEN